MNYQQDITIYLYTDQWWSLFFLFR